jgi:hypothetical protein
MIWCEPVKAQFTHDSATFAFVCRGFRTCLLALGFGPHAMCGWACGAVEGTAWHGRDSQRTKLVLARAFGREPTRDDSDSSQDVDACGRAYARRTQGRR